MNITKFTSKLSKKHLTILLISILLIISCIFAFNKLQQRIIVKNNLINDSICTNILDTNYEILRAEVVEKGFFTKHNELFFDIVTDKGLEFIDVQKLGIEVDKLLTSKYSLSNIHFNIYKSKEDFIANYDDSDDNSNFSFISDFNKSNEAIATQNIVNQDVDITTVNDISTLYFDLFSYNILDASKKHSNLEIKLVSDTATIYPNNYKNVLTGMQLLEKDIRNLNSGSKNITLRVYNSLAEESKDFILKSPYWEFNSNNKSLLKLCKSIELHTENQYNDEQSLNEINTSTNTDNNNIT